MNERSFRSKVIYLILCVAGAGLVGSLILAGIAAYIGIEQENVSSIIDLLDLGNEKLVKLGIALNHIILFAGSALIFSRYVLNANFKTYFKFRQAANFRYFALFFLLLLCAYPLIAGSGMLLKGIDLPEWAQSSDKSSIESLARLLEMNNFSDYLINILIIAVIPALGEELLFRGVIQQEVIKKLGKPVIGIIITSFIFAAVHLQIEGFAPKFIIGLILGYAYYKTANIWIPIALHFINNGLLVTAHYFMNAPLEAESMSDTESPSLLMIIFSLCLCAFIVSIISGKTNKFESFP